MKIHVTKTFSFDIKEERKRIMHCFAKEPQRRDRQIKLLYLFEQKRFGEWADAFHKLPYDSRAECSEREYVSHEIYKFMSEYMTGEWRIL